MFSVCIVKLFLVSERKSHVWTLFTKSNFKFTVRSLCWIRSAFAFLIREKSAFRNGKKSFHHDYKWKEFSSHIIIDFIYKQNITKLQLKSIKHLLFSLFFLIRISTKENKNLMAIEKSIKTLLYTAEKEERQKERKEKNCLFY